MISKQLTSGLKNMIFNLLSKCIVNETHNRNNLWNYH